jgi:hypothetical protein
MRKILTLLALAAAVPLQAQAQSNPNCSSFSNPLWLQIGDTQEPLIKALGRDLKRSTAHPQTLIYNTAGSCTNVPNIKQGTKMTTPTVHYIPAGYNGTDATPLCNNDIAGGHTIDVANAALFVSSCPAVNPITVKTTEQQGPIQAYALVVPNTSSQNMITAEEGYFVFGFGNSDGFATAANPTPNSPWNNESFMFARQITKSTLITWAFTLSEPNDPENPRHTILPANFKGQLLAASTDVENDVQHSSSPEQTIGLLGAEVYDADRTLVKELAFQWFGQKHAYLPDSTSASFDKRNLRDGHYAPWSPTYWLQQVNDDGSPVNTDADFFINMILGKQALDTAVPLDDVIAVGLVPACAMGVTRSVEAGPLSLIQPAPSCTCYYEAHVKNGSSSCAACNESTPCATGTCRNNLCEAR